MKFTDFGEAILNENDLILGLYSGKITDLSKVNIDNKDLVEKFNSARRANADKFRELTVFEESSSNIDEFDSNNRNNWLMPEDYKTLDIGEHLISLCNTDEELNRVVEELELFCQHDMIDVLKYLKYLVDTMRSNNVIWGIGRGSAVASYCLFLLGVHRIDSLKFNLDIHEFLK